MPNRRIVLLTNRSLLSASVQSLLQSEANIKLYTASVDGPGMIADIKLRNPHVIIIDSGDTSLGEGAVTQLLGHYPRAKVIALNLNRKEIEVYKVRRVVETDLAGLLKAISGRRQRPITESNGNTTDSKVSSEGGEAMGP